MNHRVTDRIQDAYDLMVQASNAQDDNTAAALWAAYDAMMDTQEN